MPEHRPGAAGRRARRPADPRGSLAARLNHLFATVRLPDREFSAADVAAWITTRGGRVSTVYIWQLRSADRTRPSEAVLGWLSRFFLVPVEVFHSEDPPEVDGALLSARVVVRDDVEVRAVLQQFLRLTPPLRAAALSIVANALATERKGTRSAPLTTGPPQGGDPDDPDTAVQDERVRAVLTLLLQLSPPARAAVRDILDSVLTAQRLTSPTSDGTTSTTDTLGRRSLPGSPS
jgi:hypothetical protein